MEVVAGLAKESFNRLITLSVKRAHAVIPNTKPIAKCHRRQWKTYTVGHSWQFGLEKRLKRWIKYVISFQFGI